MPQNEARLPQVERTILDPMEYLIGVEKAPPGSNPFVIVQDTREQTPYLFLEERYEGVLVVVAGLGTGDYTLLGCESEIGIERKSLSDYIGSISSGRERFEREMVRASAFKRFYVVIEASIDDIRSHDYQSQMAPHAVLQTTFSWSLKYGVHHIWAGTRSGGEYTTFHLLRHYYRQGGRAGRSDSSAMAYGSTCSAGDAASSPSGRSEDTPSA